MLFDIKNSPDIKRLMTRRFYVEVPYLYTLSEQEIRQRGIGGVVIDGVPTKHGSMNDTSRVYWTFERLLDAYIEGVIDVTVVGTRETPRADVIKRIYETAHEIFNIYSAGNRNTIHNSSIDEEFLKNLDNFASEIFKSSKGTLTKIADAESNKNNPFKDSGFMSTGATFLHTDSSKPLEQADDQFTTKNRLLAENTMSQFGNTPNIVIGTRTSFFKGQ